MPDFSERRPDHERKKRYRQYHATDSLLIGHSFKSRAEPSGYLALDTTPLFDNPLESDSDRRLTSNEHNSLD
ncbi:hypothetical protein [Acidobacterium sp. S8]|uniref:hypothetical protein n=1 Tax=Acidobacterium sp. S8 TaxID=1641854 RepID=UPI001C208794|nr:hypothetical protein [Acidobacterium sp. S8]